MTHRTDVPAVDIFQHKVELIETRPQRDNLLMDGRAVEPLLEESVRNILRNRVLEHTARRSASVNPGDLAVNVNHRPVNPLLLLEGEIFVLQQDRNRRQHTVLRHPHEVGAEAEG